MMTKLSLMKPGDSGKIISIQAKGLFKKRLMDMGMLVGELVTVERIAPLGDPLGIRVKNYALSLRKSDAEGISVEIS